MKKLLFVGDGPNVQSGFGKATHEILDSLRYVYSVMVLGINANGDPGTVSYPVYTCWPGGDLFGVGRLVWMCDLHKPDVIVLMNDGWNIPAYARQLQHCPEYKDIPIVAIVAVDGKNFNGKWLDGISLAVFWTQFALDEARQGGYAGPAMVIPLGVDLAVFRPVDQREARKRRRIDSLGDAFIVGNVNRNQPRKRLDLCVKYFAEWVKSKQIHDAWLYLHVAPTGDVCIDVARLAKYYGVLDRLALISPDAFYGLPEDDMRDTYNSFDVCVSTTQGEGMGLPAMEAMACGVPCILPDWSAYGDWARDAAMLVPCSGTCIGSPWQNVVGGVVDETAFIESLDTLYNKPWVRHEIADAGLKRVSEDRFRWANIGDAYAKALDGVLNPKATEAEWADLGRPEEKVIGRIEASV